SVRTSNQDVELGGNVTLRCTLQHSNIYQITWTKKKNENDENIATYKKDTGSTVLKYKDRINFIVLSLQDTAINLLNVSTEDNGCYECVFLLFPEGPVKGQPCLSVYATGFPRPNISWFPSGGEKKEKDITNPNGTLSVISNIFVSMPNVKQGLACHISHRGKMISIDVLRKEK
ncbi:OX-2 membrane glycoprotein, partial [Ophiophagus hannah]